jgi:prefoldin subunit 5
MTPDAEITSLQQQISAINAQLAQLQTDRSQNFDPSVRGRIDAQMASLTQRQQALEDALSNLQP